MSHTMIDLLTDDDITEQPSACPGALRTAQGHLPLRALDVRAQINGLVSSTEVQQTFVNTGSVPLEATYIFPLPSRAAVTRFRFETAGRVIEANIEERGKARAQYDQAVKTGHRAAIAEQERPGVFTMRVGNMLPGESATVHLTLAGPLELEGTEAVYRFPLVVAPRFNPGNVLGGGDVGDGTAPDTDQVPDASRISPPVLIAGHKNPVHLNIDIALNPLDLTLTSLKSSLHAAVAETAPEGTHRIRIQPGERLNRDFILRFETQAESLSTAAVAATDDDERGGTFALTLIPPAPAQASHPRDIVFVLDRSGSMQGWKMVAARRAVARLIDTLDHHDRFAVLCFDNSIEAAHTGLISARDRDRFAAVEFVSKCDARGGTQMFGPLTHAAELLSTAQANRDALIVLITDGQVGNESQIVGALGKHQHIRVCTVGVDRAVNAGFLRALADQSGGQCALVESEDRLDDAMATLAQTIRAPVLTQLRVHATNPDEHIEIDSLVPARLPDLLAGIPVRIFGRFSGPGISALTVSGTAPDGSPTTLHVTATPASTSTLAAIWARGRIRDLTDLYDRGERSHREEILRTSLQHGVLCRFTAFVAVDEAEVVNAGGHVHKVTQAVEHPEGWGGGGAKKRLRVGRAQPAAMTRAAPAPQGVAAPNVSAPTQASSFSREELVEHAEYDEAFFDDDNDDLDDSVELMLPEVLFDASPAAPASTGHADDMDKAMGAPEPIGGALEERAAMAPRAAAPAPSRAVQSPAKKRGSVPRGGELLGQRSNALKTLRDAEELRTRFVIGASTEQLRVVVAAYIQALTLAGVPEERLSPLRNLHTALEYWVRTGIDYRIVALANETCDALAKSAKAGRGEFWA